MPGPRRPRSKRLGGLAGIKDPEARYGAGVRRPPWARTSARAWDAPRRHAVAACREPRHRDCRVCILAWGARGLGSDAFAPIATLWTVQYVVMATFLFAVEQFIVRQVSASHGETSQLRQMGPLLWLVITAIAVVVMLIDAAIVGPNELAVIGGLWVVTMGALTMARGVAGGQASYRTAESLWPPTPSRGSCSLSAVTDPSGTTSSLAVTLALGPLPFLAWWWLRHRSRSGSPVHSANVPSTRRWRRSIGGTAIFLIATAYANGSLQLLLGGGPLVVMLLDGTQREVSAFFATTALARAPLLVAIGLVPRVLAPLTRRAAEGQYGVVRQRSWLVVAGTLVAAAIAWIAGSELGPMIVGAAYGDDFALSSVATAAAGAAVIVAIGALALNQVIVAENKPTRLIPAWTLGLLVAALVVIVLPDDPVLRVSLAALAGQTAALFGLALAATIVRGRAVPS